MTLEPLILKMISYDHGSPERIQHFLKVHSFAKTIAVSEQLDEKTLFITEAAAIVHDIGTVSYTHLTLPTIRLV